MDYLKEIEVANQRIKDLIARISNLILECPDNANIVRSSHGFTIKLNSLSNSLNLSPNFYDFKFQYKCVSEYILSSENSFAIYEIIKSKKVRYKGSYLNLHPKVCENITKALI